MQLQLLRHVSLLYALGNVNTMTSQYETLSHADVYVVVDQLLKAAV